MVLCIGCLKADGFTNGIGSGVGGPADVILLPFVGGEIVEIMQVLAGGGASRGVRAEIGQLGQRGGCKPLNLSGRHLQHVCELWHAERIIVSAKFQGPLSEGMVLVEIHPAFHAPMEWALASECELGTASDCEVHTPMNEQKAKCRK